MKAIAIYLTGACNLRCKHCSVGLDQYKPRQILSDDEILVALDRAKERGVSFVTFLGGEPTYSQHDLPRIIAHADEIGLRISINTNLFFVEKIEDLFPYRSLQNIVVSVDGACQRTHDAMRGKGSFQKTLGNLETLIAKRDRERDDITVDMTFSLSELNADESIDIQKLAGSLGIDGLNINIVQTIGRASIFKDVLIGDDEAYLESIARALVYFLISKPRFTLSIPLPPAVAAYLGSRYGIPAGKFTNANMCGGTSVYTYIDLMGNLLPCPGLSFEEGRNPIMNAKKRNLSILEKPIGEIEEMSVFKAFESMRTKRTKNDLFSPCDRCNFADTCSPCTSSYYKANEPNEIGLCKRVSNICDANGDTLGIFRPSRAPAELA